MKKPILVALCGAAFTALLALTGCGANLDRDVDVQAMQLSVPSDWEQRTAEGNTETQGSVAFEKYTDDDDDPYTAIVISYKALADDIPANAQEAIALKQQEMEAEGGVELWSIDEEKTEIVDGAQATTYEYSFEKEIDHVRKKYEYQTAYVFTENMLYQLSVYGSDASIGSVMESVELA